MLFVFSGHQSEKVSFNIWYCLKAEKKKALHGKAISRQGNKGLMFSQRKEHLRKIETNKQTNCEFEGS